MKIINNINQIKKMNRLKSITIVCLLSIAAFFAGCDNKEKDNEKETIELPFEGDGNSVATAYEIGTAAELAKLAEWVNAYTTPYENMEVYFKLTSDIDLTAYGKNWNGGKGWKSIGLSYDIPFVSHFDGNNHKVSGLYIIAI